MKNKPLRRCIGCFNMKPKGELLRLVKNEENEIVVDIKKTFQCRGTYICMNEQCIEKIKKARTLERIFKSNIKQEVYDYITNMVVVEDE